MLEIHNDSPRTDLAIAVVWAAQLEAQHWPPTFEDARAELLQQRKRALSDAENSIRKAARDVLRNGRYKPTGRGKPASEYLLRTAAQPNGTFPRINAPADINNVLSLKYVVPMSLWDVERAATRRYRFRLGRPDEAYVFNAAGQTIALQDLVVGCRILEDGTEEPIVNPVKDCQVTKTHDGTTEVAACIYGPLAVYSVEALAAMATQFEAWLAGCGAAVTTASGVVLPGEHQQIG